MPLINADFGYIQIHSIKFYNGGRLRGQRLQRKIHERLGTTPRQTTRFALHCGSRHEANSIFKFYKQPSFTVKNPRRQLVKIYHVISVYLSLTDTAVHKKIIYCTYGRVLQKFKLQSISTKIILIELLLQRKLSFIKENNQVI